MGKDSDIPHNGGCSATQVVAGGGLEARFLAWMWYAIQPGVLLGVSSCHADLRTSRQVAGGGWPFRFTESQVRVVTRSLSWCRSRGVAVAVLPTNIYVCMVGHVAGHVCAGVLKKYLDEAIPIYAVNAVFLLIKMSGWRVIYQ